jgi:hypothetical protein
MADDPRPAWPSPRSATGPWQQPLELDGLAHERLRCDDPGREALAGDDAEETAGRTPIVFTVLVPSGDLAW